MARNLEESSRAKLHRNQTKRNATAVSRRPSRKIHKRDSVSVTLNISPLPPNEYKRLTCGTQLTIEHIMTERREHSDSRITTKLPKYLSESLGQNVSSPAATIKFINQNGTSTRNLKFHNV